MEAKAIRPKDASRRWGRGVIDPSKYSPGILALGTRSARQTTEKLGQSQSGNHFPHQRATGDEVESAVTSGIRSATAKQALLQCALRIAFHALLQ